MLSSQVFLQIEFEKAGKVAGNCIVEGFEGWIELGGFGWGLKASGEANMKRNSRVEFDHFTAAKGYDRATNIFLRCLNAQDKFTAAKVVVVHGAMETGSSLEERATLVVDLSNGYLTKVDLGVSGGDKSADITENIDLSFQQVKFFYYPAVSAAGGKRKPPMSLELEVDTFSMADLFGE